MHRTHRAVGSIFSLLIAAWFASGAVMAFSGFPRFTEDERLASSAPLPHEMRLTMPPALATALARAAADGSRPRLSMLEDTPTWTSFDPDDRPLAVRAEDGRPVVPLDAARIRREATKRFGLRVASSSALTRSDQWTVAIADSSNLPLERVRFADDAATEAYFLARTGEVVQHSTRRERMLAWIGAIPHWVYPTILRRERELWRYAVLVLSAIGMVITLSGTIAGLHVHRATRRRGLRRDRTLRWHQTLGLWFGVFATTWLFSGALSLNPFAWTGPRGPSTEARAVLRQAPPLPRADQLASVLARCQKTLSVRELELTALGGHLYAVCTDDARTTRVADLTSDDDALVPRLPMQRFASLAEALGHAATAELVDEFDAYHYPTHGAPFAARPFVRIALHDADQTTYYLDPARARLLRTHTDRTRLERWLYHGLHSFDLPGLYEHRAPWRALIVVAMVLGFALSTLGTWMTVRRQLRKRTRRRRTSAAHALE